MTTVVEPLLALEFVFDILAADATLTALATGGIHTDIVPEGGTFPRVMIQQQAAANDLLSDNEASLVWSTPILAIKAIDQSATYATVKDIAGRIYELLTNTEGLVTGGRIVSCIRDFTLLQPETDQGVQYRTILQQFRLEAYATP